MASNCTGLLVALACLPLAACLEGAGTIQGQLRAPAGTRVVIASDVGDTLDLSVPTDAPYGVADFELPAVVADGTDYTVTVDDVPESHACSVYSGGTGTTPATQVRVGCEIVEDLVSRSTDNAVLGTAFESTSPVISSDGRFSAFVSSALFDGASGRHRQVFWRDSLSGETLLVSTGATGEGGGDSTAPAISGDGSVVAFVSAATNLASGDANGVTDVYVWNALAPSNPPVRVSVGPGGLEADGPSGEPVLSFDGGVVAFSSSASNLTAGVDGTSTVNVYRRVVSSGATTLISANDAGDGVGGSLPSLSEDGNRLAFYSFSSQLVSGDTNGLWDIFVFEAGSSAIQRVSLTSTGGERDQGTESASRIVAPSLSGDGRFVSFATTADNMVPDDDNGAQDVFVIEVDTGSVTRASTANGVEGNRDSPVGQGERVGISRDGTWIAFTTKATNLGAPENNVVLHNRESGETVAASQQTGTFVGAPALSGNAAYVAFAAGVQLDTRFESTGLFVHFTGLERAWWWNED